MSWLGRILNRILPTPPPRRPDNSVSRREFISGGFIAAFAREMAGAAPVTVAPPVTALPPIPVLRPPGAVPEADFLAGCTRCGDCITACPHKAIVLAPARLGAAAGTPMIAPIDQPCLMCVDTPCITACKPAVLRRPEDEPIPRIGTARISTVDCLAHQGTACTTCSERCPVAGAITLTDQRPQVVPDLCTGCGICVHVCPAPQHAILLRPAVRR